jgi:hypothetical protein
MHRQNRNHEKNTILRYSFFILELRINISSFERIWTNNVEFHLYVKVDKLVI